MAKGLHRYCQWKIDNEEDISSDELEDYLDDLADIELREEPPGSSNVPNKFDLDNLSELKCVSYFGFHKRDLARLRKALLIPDSVATKASDRVDGIEGLCIFLISLFSASSLQQQFDVFRRSEGSISRIRSTVFDMIHTTWGHLIELDPHRLTPGYLQQCCDVLVDCGSPLPNLCGFVDCIFQPLAKCSGHDKARYNESLKMFGYRYQALVTPDGLIQALYGPYDGSRNELDIYFCSSLRTQLQQLNMSPTSAQHCHPIVHGGEHYISDDALISPVSAATLGIHSLSAYHVSSDQHGALLETRAVLQWAFNKIDTLFPVAPSSGPRRFNRPVDVSAGRFMAVATVIANCHTCLNGPPCAETQFALTPIPSLDSYLVPNAPVTSS